MSLPFDAALAHKQFSAHCFNATWELLDLTERTESEQREMLSRSLASLWHWRQRADVTPKNLSIGCWQVARVCAVIGEPRLAARFAEESLDTAGDDLFLRGYALEGLARAAMMSGDVERAGQLVEEARALAGRLLAAGEREALLADLATVGV
jgi:hypothetical protein